MLDSILTSRKAIVPLSLLTVISYGFLDAITTLLCLNTLSANGFNAMELELSPLIRSGLFGSGGNAVILSKAFILAVIFAHLFVLSRYERFVPIINTCLIAMITVGAIATVNNINIDLGGTGVTFFSLNPLMISLIIICLVGLYCLHVFLKNGARVPQV